MAWVLITTNEGTGHDGDDTLQKIAQNTHVYTKHNDNYKICDLALICQYDILVIGGEKQ